MRIKFIKPFEIYKPGDTPDIHSRFANQLIEKGIAIGLNKTRMVEVAELKKAMNEEE
jgi:hypothetical protein